MLSLVIVAALAVVQESGSPSACRAIVDRDARLACYDGVTLEPVPSRREQESATAPRSKDAAGAGPVRGTRTMPSAPVEARIASASQSASGRWTFRLEDGTMWAQIDDRRLNIDPHAGQSIRIRPAAMGSFLANVNRQIAIRVLALN